MLVRSLSAIVPLIVCWPASAQTYTISTFAGGVLPVNIAGTSASLTGVEIEGVAVDTAGNVFFPAQNAIFRLDAQTGILTAVAGNGTVGFSGDNGPATSAQLNNPYGVAVDSAGNVYFADRTNLRIREVSNGVITTVAGSGTSGFSGDNGPALNAQLNLPTAVAVDSSGNLYISDTGNNRIRKVSNGVITTVAGNGQAGYNGDNMPAAGAELNEPWGIALDSTGNLYIADYENYRIREVANGTITTVAGNGQAGYSGDNGPATSAALRLPIGVAVDSAGDLYIGDYANDVVRKVTNGVITTVAGKDQEGFSGDNGPATSAAMTVYALAVGSTGNLFIADGENYRIREVSSGIIATVAGGGTPLGNGGPAVDAQLFPSGVAIDSAGDLYISDPGNNRVLKVANGVITTVAGNGAKGYSGDNGPATSAELYFPEGLAVDSAGNLYIADFGNCAIRKVANGVITTVAGSGVYGFSGDNGPATSAKITYTYAVAVDSAGNIYLTDGNNDRIRMVSNGTITTVAGAGTLGFSGDNGPATSATLHYPYGLAVDSANNLYIADSYNNRIRKIVNGVITTVAGNGTASFSGDNGPATSAELDAPYGIALDAAGNLYIADYYNYRIREVSNGTITTIAGGGAAFGDNGPATSAQLNGPLGVAVTPTGNLYVSDYGDGRIRLLSSLPASLSVSSSHAGNFTQGQNGAVYTVTVSNGISAGVTSAAVTVTDTLPSGLTMVSMSGAGWNCSGAACSRSDVLEPGTSYPALTVTVNVAANAPSQAANQVAVSGGGSASAAAVDVTTIAAGEAPSAVTVFSPGQAATSVPVTTSLTWTVPAGASSFAVYFGTSTPPPLVVASTAAATYSPTLNPATTYYWSVAAANGFGSTPSAVWSFTTALPVSSGYRFVPVTPCRVLDTRNATGTFGGPSIGAGATRTVPMPQSACNIPATAVAYSLNITVVPPGPLTYLSVWPAGQPQPAVSTLNSFDGRVVANAAIVPAGTSGGIDIYASNATDAIVDINGYFAPPSEAPSAPGGMSFYTATPCRVVDTRTAAGPFGGPYLSGGSTRSFAIPSSSCGTPATAQAYALNVTVVPHGPLNYLTMWPTGQSQPYVSTLNAQDGSVVANAAIVPAGNSGAVSVYATNDTDVIIDINGYFAPPGASNALSLYTLTPCRVADTRQASGPFGGPSLAASGTRNFAIPASACTVPVTAQAYSLNVTVVPPGPLTYLTAWPAGQAQPNVSTLNSYYGKVVANAAIVPAGTSGAVNIFASNVTDVVLDINAYFAQ